MKRPEGFDPQSRRQASPASRAGARPPQPATPEKSPKPAKSVKPAKPANSPKPPKPSSAPNAARRAAPATRANAATSPPRVEKVARPTAPSRRERNAPIREARRALRVATRDRRRYERREVRRFTARQRARRRALLALGSVVVVLAITFAVAVFSPILALRHIRIDGTDRLDAATLQTKVSDQLGTPLALVDMARITKELGTEPLIASYTTETVPPDTLVISITERQPIGVVENGTQWDQVDPAGVVIQSSAKRPSNLPVMSVTGGVDSVAFTTAATVLRTIPASMLKDVHSISASTADDAEFVLSDGTRVLWGSIEKPALKAEVLANLMQVKKKAGIVRYNVSSVPTTASYTYP